MHKIVLFLSIFCILPVHAMIQPCPKSLPVYQETTPLHALLAQKKIMDILFPSNDQLNELATLIKKFGYKKNLKKLIEYNILSLINLTKTDKTLYFKLQQEVKNKTELSHVSCNNISRYFNQHNFEDWLSDNHRANHCIEIFSARSNDLSIGISLIRKHEACNKLHMYNKKEYINIYNLCNEILCKYKNNQPIKNVCETLQEECNTMHYISKENTAALLDLLYHHKEYNYIRKLRGYTVLARLTIPTTFELSIWTLNDDPTVSNITFSSLNSKELKNIFLKCPPIKANGLQYADDYESFLQTLQPCALVSKETGFLTFETDCGFSDKPTIPVDIICIEHLIIKDK